MCLRIVDDCVDIEVYAVREDVRDVLFSTLSSFTLRQLTDRICRKIVNTWTDSVSGLNLYVSEAQ